MLDLTQKIYKYMVTYTNEEAKSCQIMIDNKFDVIDSHIPCAFTVDLND